MDNAALRAEIVRQARDVARTTSWPAGRLTNTGEALHAFAQHELRYKEDQATQRIARPAAFVHGVRVGDCKSTAVLIAGLARSAGCDAVVRFIREPGAEWYHHVYALVDGVPCDPLIDYGTEVVHVEREDHYI